MIIHDLNDNSHNAKRDTLEYQVRHTIFMRVGYSLGSLLSIDNVIQCSGMVPEDTDSIWIPETWGMENFAMLGVVAQQTRSPRIGSSIINIYSRSPATIAMGAATIDTISKGRLALGLGTSSIPIVENFHGYEFKDPVSRMREYIKIIRMILSLQKIKHSGDIFRLKGFSLLVRPPRNKIPIYVAAINQKMVRLAWDISDGVIFYLRPIDEMRGTISKMQAGRKIDVASQIIACVSEDAEAAILRAKKTLAFYISVGSIYREFLRRNGFGPETKNISEEYEITGLSTNHEMVTDRMVKSLAVAGAPDDCIKGIARFRSAGVDLPIMQFNPVGDVKESFRVFVRTFSGGI